MAAVGKLFVAGAGGGGATTFFLITFLVGMGHLMSSNMRRCISYHSCQASAFTAHS